MSSLARERLASNRSASRSATAEPSASAICSKCGRAVFGRATKRGNHPACPRRKRKRGTRKVRRPPKPGRLSKLAWEVRKGEVFLRDEMQCRYLGFGLCEGPLDVHHIVHRSKGGTDDSGNLILLCRRHHNWMHPEKSLRWSKRSAAA